MTGTTVIDDRVREQLDDTVAGDTERWSDAVLMSWLNDGGRIITVYRPESLLTAPHTLGSWADVTALGDTISIDDRYRGALVDYILYRAFGQNAQDEFDKARSDDHLNSFVVKSGVPKTFLG